jgi:lactate 2-monooxygenase
LPQKPPLQPQYLAARAKRLQIGLWSHRVQAVTVGIGRERQFEIYVAGARGAYPGVPVSFDRLEARARAAMTPEGYAYIAGGAGTEETMRENRAAFERRRIVPRMLRDVSVRDTAVEILGTPLPSPFVLCPIGVLEMAHRDADVAVARAAAAEGVPYVFSNQASRPMEECAAAMGDAPRWFQLYWSTSDELVASLVSRAERCGCSAIVLTLDTTMLGWRIRDLDLAYLPFLRGKGIAQYTSDPVFVDALQETLRQEPPPGGRITLAAIGTLLAQGGAYPGPRLGSVRSGIARAAVRRFVETYSRPSLSWDDLGFLREKTRLPILLKGILHPADALAAIEHGMDGLVVSNHGGRQVDGALGTMDALPAVVEAVGGRIPVLLDSGVRSGADVFRALALGAAAVGLGRPYVWGLAAGGADGVREVIRNLRADFDLTMGLAGCAAVGDIGPESVQLVG